MPKEVISPEEAARAQEFPDRVGFKPDNPFLASFRPYIDAGTVIPEFTARAIILGTLLGIIFGASSLYLVLKVGLTVSASIPVAVISISIFALAFAVKDPQRDDPRKQHRADGGFGGRVDRLRCRRHDAGDHDSRFRP